MLSISGKYWEEIKVNNRILEKVKNDNNFSEIISKIVISRNFTKEEISSINQNIEISNPFINNNDFIKGHSILKESIDKNEKILIIGDYDVDGCVATSLIVNFFNLIKKDIEYYIPNRFIDGYGASLKLVNRLVKKNPDLIIMLDCGSNSIESIRYLNKKKIKTIIIDHHEIYKPYPNTECLINPKKECEYNNYEYLCTSTLVYFFIISFFKDKTLKKNYEKNLIYVVLATICDVMPLRKLNRVLVINVLKNMKKNKVFLFQEILRLKKMKRSLELNDFGFLVGPIINSAGRLGDANKIVKLLTTNNQTVQKKIIKEIIITNEKRKKIENDYFKDINLTKIEKLKSNVIILTNNMMNEGIIGIVASRLKEYYNKPSVVLTKSGDFYKASARSTHNFNIGKLIKAAIDKNIILKGGGHNLAAGFLIKKEKLSKFEVFINDAFNKNNLVIKENYISKISPFAINSEFYKNLKILEPFGPRNTNPKFLIENIEIIKPKIVNNKFISFYIKSKYGKLIPSMSFNFLESNINKMIMNNKKKMNLIVQIKENIWNNKRNLQLTVIDIIVDLNKA